MTYIVKADKKNVRSSSKSSIPKQEFMEQTCLHLILLQAFLSISQCHRQAARQRRGIYRWGAAFCPALRLYTQRDVKAALTFNGK